MVLEYWLGFASGAAIALAWVIAFAFVTNFSKRAD